MAVYVTPRHVLEGKWGECRWMIVGDTLEVWPEEAEGRIATRRGNLMVHNPWRGHQYVRSVVFREGVRLPQDASGLLFGMSRLEVADLSAADGTSALDVSWLLAECPRLRRALLPTALGAVTSAAHMLDGCTSLERVDLSALGAPALRDATAILSGCVNLESVVLDGWGQASLTGASRMFDDCRHLASVDVASWDMSRVGDMSFMYAGCRSLEAVGVDSWDVGTCHDFNGMFAGCASLRMLDLSRWELGVDVGSMHYMFAACTSLEALSLKGWDTEEPHVFSHMFDDCPRLKVVDLDGWRYDHAQRLGLPAHTACRLGGRRLYPRLPPATA